MNQVPVDPPSLRPLGIGEVLDRAVTMSVRYFVPLALVIVFYEIALGIVQYFTTRGITQFAAVLQTLAKAGTVTGRRPDIGAIVRNSTPEHFGVALFCLFVLAFLVSPLPAAALIESVSAFYLGRSLDFANAYRIALGRWLPLIVLNVVYALAALFLYLAVTLVVFALALAVAFLYAASHAAGIALGIIVGVAAVVMLIAFAMLVTLAFHVSYFTLVLEGVPAIRAFVTGVERVFSQRGLKRSLLFGAAYFAISLGVVTVSGVGGPILLLLSHSDVPVAIYATILRLVVTLFTAAFIAIFYYDLRVREEGFDLQLAAQAERASLAR